MNKQDRQAKTDLSRRQFLKRSSAALAGAAAAVEAPFVHAAGAEGDLEIKIGLIGCGGRGTGAVLDALGAATRVIYPAAGYHTEDVAQGARIEKKRIKIVALADLFADRLAKCNVQLAKLGIEVPAKTCFTGFDAYKHLLGPLRMINYVILATPPRFRRVNNSTAAVKAGKHVFMEKPVAVDVPGVQTVIEPPANWPREKGLGIAAGTQRRHMNSYREAIQRIQDGAIGDLVYGRCYWNGGEIWVIQPRGRLERHGVAAAQLELLHLALGRPHRRAARSQPRYYELGDGNASRQGRLRTGRTPGPHRPRARPHLRPFRRRVRVPGRSSHVQPAPGRSTAVERRGRGGEWSAPRA